MLRWQQAAGKRHALIFLGNPEIGIGPDHTFEALCGKLVTTAAADVLWFEGRRRSGLWLARECRACHDEWLRLDAISPNLVTQ